MKKYLILTVALVCAVCHANAQFKLTPGGLKNAANNDVEYVEIDCTGKSAADIYNSVYGHILINAPWINNSVFSLGNEIISVEATAIESVAFRLGTTLWMDMDFRVVLVINDGKVRVSVPAIWRIYYDMGEDGVSRIYVGGSANGNWFEMSSIFKSDGRQKYEMSATTIEGYFNTFLASLSFALE